MIKFIKNLLIVSTRCLLWERDMLFFGEHTLDEHALGRHAGLPLHVCTIEMGEHAGSPIPLPEIIFYSQRWICLKT